METTQKTASSLLWLALATLAALVALGALSRIEVPTLSRHAVEKHGRAAQRVHRRMCAADDCDVWQRVCPDGKRYTIHARPGNTSWDISIDSADGSFNFTAFPTTNATWVAKILRWCE